MAVAGRGIRPAFSQWPDYNRRLMAAVAAVSDEQLLVKPSADRRQDKGDRVHSRGWVLQRVFSHDVWHAAELNEALTANGLPQVDFWE